METPNQLQTIFFEEYTIYIMIWRIRLSARTQDFHSWKRGSTPLCATKILRGRAVVARKAHNLEDGGSIPSPATN